MSRYNPLKPTKTAVKPRPEPLPKGTIPNAEPVSSLPTLTENDVKDGLELRFPVKPAEAVLEQFRQTKHLPPEHRWHWHFRKHFWYARRNDVTRAFAAAILGQGVPPALQPPLSVPDHQFNNPLIHQSESNIVPVDFAPPPDDNPVHVINTGALPIWRSRFLRHNQPS